ncbi:hypothetical protein LTR36_005994 [Oleoguttula mirabilis]|uniref:Uncharacterized protein n=1 Tax=Oleoguttula mirabilis TaxID=1507867 RepID=A0AAV9JCX9_9PEZI|nr:hypothetical protein LTR36_005994 [Oleoguttula mirabilis]
MEDYEPREFSPTVPDIPSQHSGFRSHVGSEYSEASSRRSYSPPAWRKAGSGWFQHPSLSPNRGGFRSKEPSPQYHDAEEEGDGDVTAYRIATRVPLPGSPMKGRSPSNSPEPVSGPSTGEVDRGGGGLSHASHVSAPTEDAESPALETPTQSNYFRFSTRLDVVHKTQPIEDTVLTLRKIAHDLSASKWRTFCYAITALSAWMLAANLFSTPSNGPVPDLIKVAGLAKSLEPAIYYSERGHAQIGELQETGVAVWDLGESVRNTNMTSAPIIVRQLDDLSDSIKTLALELTRFFAGVDGDIDAILLTMEWAQRELTTLSSTPPSTISSVWSNTHSLLSRVGLMSQGQLAQSLLGMTHQQLTRATLERVFNEYLTVLEDAINTELTYSMQLFQLFEAIDKQFLNLQRSVIREQDTQEKLENDFLSSLWTKVIGVNASKLRKYEKNKDLLASVRDRTVRNKHVLVDHNQRLRQLQSNLETLRRKLVSPLVRSQNSSTLSVEEQVKGLEGTYHQLKSSREVQRRKMMEIVYGAGDRRHGSGVHMVGEPTLEARTAHG